MNEEMLLLILMSNMLTFLLSSLYYKKSGFNLGYVKGIQDERLFMGVAISRAFKENKEEALRDVQLEYKRMLLELDNRDNLN